MSNIDVTRLPLDVSRCTGRQALLSDHSGEQVPVMMRTDERGFCAFYLYMEIGGE